MRASRTLLRPPVILAVLMSLAPVSSLAAPLEGAAAWAALIGNTVVTGTNGGGTTDYFAPDGSIRRLDQDGRTSGGWSVEGDSVCLDFPDDDDRICVKPRVDGTTGTFRDPDGHEDAFTILPGNAKGL
jgi:hypothetical protein